MRAPDKIQSIKVLRSRNIPIETIIDVGVQCGTSELVTAFPDKPHLLFEPVREYTAQIHNNYKNINYTLVEAAVSDKEGDATLQTVTTDGGGTITHSGIIISGPVDYNLVDKRVVPTVTLDRYLLRHPQKPPYLVKLDVDGFELQIMQGAIDTLQKTSVVIVETMKYDLTERISFLEAHGFEIFDLVDLCYYDQRLWQCDAVLLKKPLGIQYFSIPQEFSPAKWEAFHLAPDETWFRALISGFLRAMRGTRDFARKLGLLP
jgi:FkbM family methyltransferase